MQYSDGKNQLQIKLQLVDESLLYLGEDSFGLLRLSDPEGICFAVRDAKLRDSLPSLLNQL